MIISEKKVLFLSITIPQILYSIDNLACRSQKLLGDGINNRHFTRDGAGVFFLEKMVTLKCIILLTSQATKFYIRHVVEVYGIFFF